MIVPDRKMSWTRLVLEMRRVTLPRIRSRLLAVLGVSIAVTAQARLRNAYELDLTIVPFTLIGLALGVFLGFRNNTSYDRFWEGRKLWGRLVNDARSFARLTLNIIVPDATGAAKLSPDETRELQQAIIYRTIAYVHALRMHLRNQLSVLTPLEPFLSKEELGALHVQRNAPQFILQHISALVARARRGGVLRHRDVHLLENLLTDMCDVQGGCERIKSTPIPWSYTVLTHSIVAAYCFALPFGLVATTKLATPMVVALIAYAFLGLDAVGDELEEPFGADENDLPLDMITRTIEVNLRQALGEQSLPALIKPGPDRVVR